MSKHSGYLSVLYALIQCQKTYDLLSMTRHSKNYKIALWKICCDSDRRYLVLTEPAIGGTAVLHYGNDSFYPEK